MLAGGSPALAGLDKMLEEADITPVSSATPQRKLPEIRFHCR